MTCGDKFNQNCPTYGSRVDPAEVDGRPRCGYPNCGKRLRGDSTCVDGHSQNPADWQIALGTAAGSLLLAAQKYPNFTDADGEDVLLYQQGQLELLCRSGNNVYTYRREGDSTVEEVDYFGDASEAASALNDYVAAAGQQGAVQHCPRCGRFISVTVSHQCLSRAAEPAALPRRSAANGEAQRDLRTIARGAAAPPPGALVQQQLAAHLQTLLDLDQELEAARQLEEPDEFEIAVTRIGYGHNTITVAARSEREAIAQAVDEAGDYDYSEDESEYEPEEDGGLREINAARDWLATAPAEADTAEGRLFLQALASYLTSAAEEAGRVDDPRLQAAREYLAVPGASESAPAPTLPRGTVVLAPAEAERLRRLLSEVWDKLNIANGIVDPYGDEDGEPPDEDGVARFVPESLLDALAEWERRVEQPRPVIAAEGGSTPQPAATAPPTEWRRDNLPYAAVSVSPGAGRAMEWKEPLWAAINKLVDTPPTQRVPLVNAVEAAVEQAMVVALNAAAAAKMLDTVPTEPFPRHWPEGAEWYYPGNATFVRVVAGQLHQYDPRSKTWAPSVMTRAVATEGVSIRRPRPASELLPIEEGRDRTTEE